MNKTAVLDPVNDTVTLPRKEYEALLDRMENLADILAYDRSMADEYDSLPHEFMARLIDGEHPLTVYREWRGFSKMGLAKASGVNRIQITNIENGKSNGSFDTIRKLTDILFVPMDDLVSMPAASENAASKNLTADST